MVRHAEATGELRHRTHTVRTNISYVVAGCSGLYADRFHPSGRERCPAVRQVDLHEVCLTRARRDCPARRPIVSAFRAAFSAAANVARSNRRIAARSIRPERPGECLGVARAIFAIRVITRRVENHRLTATLSAGSSRVGRAGSTGPGRRFRVDLTPSSIFGSRKPPNGLASWSALVQPRDDPELAMQCGPSFQPDPDSPSRQSVRTAVLSRDVPEIAFQKSDHAAFDAISDRLDLPPRSAVGDRCRRCDSPPWSTSRSATRSSRPRTASANAVSCGPSGHCRAGVQRSRRRRSGCRWRALFRGFVPCGHTTG